MSDPWVLLLLLLLLLLFEKTVNFNQLNNLMSIIIANSLSLKELHKFKSIISNQKQLQVIKFY